MHFSILSKNNNYSWKKIYLYTQFSLNFVGLLRLST